MGGMKDLRLWGILLIGLALRALLFSAAIRDEDRAFTADSRDYWDLSREVFDGRYVSDRWVLRQPEIFRTPGYPAFLTLGRHIPWRPGRAISSWRASLAIQVFLDLHLILVTFALGRELAGHRAGLWAALLFAVSPLAVGASCRLLSDSVFAFLLTTALWAFAVHLKRTDWRSLLATGALLGLACYVRPIGLAMTAVFALVLLSQPRRLRRAGALLGVVGALVGPWVVRNAVVADYVGFSSFAGESLYWYSAAEVLAARDPNVPTAETARRRLECHEVGIPRVRGSAPAGKGAFLESFLSRDPNDPPPRSLAVGDLARYRRRLAWKILSAHPWTYAGIHLKGCLAFWLPGATDVLEVAGYTAGSKGTLGVLHEKGLAAAVRHYFGGNTAAMAMAAAMSVLLLIRYLGVLLCVVRRFRFRLPATAWLGLGLVAVSFLLPGPAGHPRFRVPVVPLLSVAAAMGWMGLFRGREARKASAGLGPEPVDTAPRGEDEAPAGSD